MCVDIALMNISSGMLYGVGSQRTVTIHGTKAIFLNHQRISYASSILVYKAVLITYRQCNSPRPIWLEITRACSFNADTLLRYGGSKQFQGKQIEFILCSSHENIQFRLYREWCRHIIYSIVASIRRVLRIIVWYFLFFCFSVFLFEYTLVRSCTRLLSPKYSTQH